MLSAMIGPIPSTSTSSSADASAMRSMWPTSAARATAAVGPTWRMPSPTSSLARGRFFDASMASKRLVADFSARRSRPISVSSDSE